MMMASSSSSLSFSANPQIPQVKYDVFLSFRGEDTRYNFTSHFHAALSRKNIEVFIDYQLKRGDEISPSLVDAIEASMTFVIIFSKDYASSSWCLDELVKILECKNKYERSVFPIFYHIDPSNVRKQTGIFGDGFTKLIDQQQHSQEKLHTWSCALSHASKLSGYHVNSNKSEYTLIEEIVDDILKKLNETFSIPRDDKDYLIGVDSRIKEIESLLSDESKVILTLGIWGTGGIGKTTIGTAIFKRISSCFEGSCFISNVRGEEEKHGGLNHLQRQLLSTLLIDQILKNETPNIGVNFESKRLSRKRVLIVLDDISHFEQIELLIGGLQFAVGSRIIITTRDKHVLNICGVDFVYEMKRLAYEDALKLFSQHAFKQNYPNGGFEDLSRKVISYASGIPLALKVLGRFLVRRDKEEWESAINKLKEIPNMEILKVLKISYDSLDDKEKQIFLDIACLLQHVERNLVIKFLDACDYFGQIGIRVLIDRSLISISKHNILEMHDLLRDMGREIVRQESVNDPGKRSRLWHCDDVYKVLTCNKGTETIEGISLNMFQVKELRLDLRVFTKMPKLRFLRFFGNNKFTVSISTLIFFRFLNMSNFQGPTLDELRYFEWHGYPLNTLPLILHPENLVSIKMPHSNIKQLWNGVQNLGNLKHLELQSCKQLCKIPNLTLAQNLERLDLRLCTSLIEIHSSIKLLNKLKFFSVGWCSNLRWFPEVTSPNLKYLQCGGTAIEEVPSSIGSLSGLKYLGLSDCKQLKRLPTSLHQLKSLTDLLLRGCWNLQRSTNKGENLEAMKNVDGSETGTREAPSSIPCLSGISHHHPLNFLSYDGLHSLCELNLVNCGIKELPENIFGSHLSSLRDLCLDGNDFERIPESIAHLPEVLYLSFSECKMLKYLPKLPCRLSYLNVNNCTSLESLSGLFKSGYLSSDQLFEFENCVKLDLDELKIIEKDFLQKSRLHLARWYNTQRNLHLYRRFYSSDYKTACFWSRFEGIMKHFPEKSQVWGETGFSGLDGIIRTVGDTSQITIAHCLGQTCCPDRGEPKRIEKDVLQKSQARCKEPFGEPFIRRTTCYPGSEIPDWFEYRSMGSSITLKLPPGSGCFNNNLLGFVFCVIITDAQCYPKKHPLDVHVCCECKLKTKDGDWHDFFSLDVGFTHDYVRSDHVFLRYSFRNFVREFYEDDEAIFRFYFGGFDGVERESCQVIKKCGVHLFHSQDLMEESAENYKGSSRASRIEQQEPHPKKLKY